LRLSQIFQPRITFIKKTGDEEGEIVFLVRLEGVLDSAEKVKEVAGLEEMPVVRTGRRDRNRGRWGRMLSFCEIDREAKERIEAWFVQKGILME